MRPFIFMTIILLVIASCKKEIKNVDSSAYIENIKASMRDSLSTADYSKLEFSKAVLSKADSVSLYYLRIPFMGKDLRNDFIIVNTDVNGIVEYGKIIHIEGGEKTYHYGSSATKRWDGNIIISSLDRKKVLPSAISNGFIMAFHHQNYLRTDLEAPVYADPYISLPEVVIVAYTTNGSGISYSDWILFQSLFNDYGGGGGSSGSGGGYYGSMGGGGGGYYGGSGGGPTGGGNPIGGGLQSSPPIMIDYENQYSDPAIDLNKFLNCFSNIPDAGATCSIKILTDIPVDDDPNKFFDWSNGSPGHTFLQIEKSNGNQIAFQNIGFYPRSGWKTALTPAPIDGKFVDNGGHEYNASLQMKISPAQLQSAINEMLYLGRFVKYDVDEYNCTDWALEVFNYIRNPADQLIIPKFDLPYGEAPNGSNTPEGLYLKLQEMKKTNSSEANNINIGFKKGIAGSSTGPCN